MDMQPEIQHWKTLLTNPDNRDWINKNLDPSKELIKTIKKYIFQQNQRKLKILDVGSGPISVLGNRLNGLEIDLTCADPLADHYKEILNSINVSLPYSLVKCAGENINEAFPANTYDIVFSRNALDHAMKPHIAITKMLNVCKENGKCIIEVFLNEAINSRYLDLHQWNFATIDKHVFIWSPFDAYILDKVVEGFPYRFQISDGDPNRTYPYTLTICIHKPPLSLEHYYSFNNGLFLYNNISEGFITLYKTRTFDSSKRFFIHINQNNRIVQNISFSWFGDILRKSFILDTNKIDSISIGQYEYATIDNKRRPVNFWKKIVHL